MRSLCQCIAALTISENAVAGERIVWAANEDSPSQPTDPNVAEPQDEAQGMGLGEFHDDPTFAPSARLDSRRQRARQFVTETPNRSLRKSGRCRCLKTSVPKERRVADPRPVPGRCDRMTEFSEDCHQVVQALGVDPIHRRIDERVGDSSKDGVLDAVLRRVQERYGEQGPQSLLGVGDRQQSGDDVRRGSLLPSAECGIDQFTASLEVPVKASFGYPERERKRFDGHRFDARFTDNGKGRVGPILSGQSIP